MSSNFPSLVIIIRHGEKAGDPSNDAKGGPDLSIRGSARAAALPSLFTLDPAATPPTPLVEGQPSHRDAVDVRRRWEWWQDSKDGAGGYI